MKPDDTNAACGGCGTNLEPWITTCPNCGASSHYPSEEISLASEVAPAMVAESTWIDVPLSADEPVRVALFRHFLNERSFDFEESRRFISIRVDEADAIATAVRPWAFDHDMPDDPRVHDSLAYTLSGVGTVVLAAIEEHRTGVTANVKPPDQRRIDLR